jgi:3-oxoacyl-[acyl-carrier protein] reductase
MSLVGRTAIVTGASRGLGKAIARRLAQEGAAVGINYIRSAQEAEALASEISAAGGKALPVQADVAKLDQVTSMVEKVERQLGPVDILVNNAGVLQRGDLDDFDYSEMDGMRRVNVDGVVYATRAVIQGMKTRTFGRIVNLTSIAAHGTAMAGTTFYAATKAAVSILTRRFAMELGPYGITVNAVAPGFIMTDMVRDNRTPEEVEGLQKAIAAKTMMRRVGWPEDIGHAVAFLVSPESVFITAQIITVDGGRMDYLVHP